MKEHDELIELLLRTDEPDARRELNERLRNDPAAREVAARYLADEASLTLSLKTETIAGIVEDSSGVINTMDRPRVRTRTEIALRWAVGMAAGFAVLAGVLFSKLQQPDDPGHIMTITDLNGSLRWTGDGGRVVENLQEGQLLGGGTLETLASDSAAAVVFMDGSRVTLAGLSMITIADFGQKELRLHKGVFSANVNPQTKPMLVHTPTAVAEVLGTQFNLSAEPQSTELTVNGGRVRMTRLADGQSQEVSANHLAVASLDRRDPFEATKRPEQVNTWLSTLPWDQAYGEFIPGENGQPNALAATPMLWEPKPNEKHVLQIAVLKVATGDSPPTVLESASKFRVRGRAKNKGKIFIGFSTHHRNGGFAGKYVAPTEVASEPGELFEIEIPHLTDRIGDDSLVGGELR